MPGSYTDIMIFKGASPESIQAFEKKWGLDEPLYVQYYSYVINFLQFEFGQSLQFRQPVLEYARMKVFNTFILVGPGITLAYVLGAVFGTVLGSQRGSKLEQYSLIPIIASGSFPSFFIAIVLIVVFAGFLNIFPTSGISSGAAIGTYDTWWGQYLTIDFAMHYILPFTAVVLRYISFPSLIMRTSIVEIMGQDFIHYQKMTGLPKLNRLRHLGKHASLPLITLYPVSMTRAIGGLVLIEVVFNWPGMGFALVQAVFSRDFPVLQFIFFVIAAFVILSNFAVDIIYGIIDPRVSVEN
jgi:peptide/nickel transport system permease protein